MKKSLIAVVALALAISAFGQIGRYSVGLGPMNTASNSNYATTTGYFAGYEGVGLTRTSLFGSLAGQNAHYTQRSVGIGYGALYKATNCNDCVAIGDRAGAKWRNATGWVDVGGAFVYTNGVADIKAVRGAKIGPLQLGADAYDQDHDLKGNLSVQSEYNPTTGTSIGGRIYAGDYIEAPHGYFAQAQIGEISFISSAVTIGTDENMRLCVYTNGVLAGYLTITPPAQGQ